MPIVAILSNHYLESLTYLIEKSPQSGYGSFDTYYSPFMWGQLG